jgi:hypothetical protein
MFKRAFLLLSFACLAAASLRAADDPMVGDWKLNPAKSKLSDEMKVTSLGGNKYSLDFGGGNPETIVADGTDQPANFGTTFAVTEVSPDEWRGVRKKDGRVEITGIWKLSKDGNTLHDDFTYIPDNGNTGGGGGASNPARRPSLFRHQILALRARQCVCDPQEELRGAGFDRNPFLRC